MSYDAIASEYDAAFAWESDPGMILPVWNALGHPSRVVEFACGPARLLSTLVANGAFGVGVDVSGAMLEIARDHLEAAGGEFELHQTSLEDFQADEACGGAFCAVGSFGHLHSRAAALAHLERVRRTLEPGGRYAVQLSLKPLVQTQPQVPAADMGWEFKLHGETLRYIWYGTGVDPVARQEIQRSRFEWLTGPRKGEVVENDHLMAIWDWDGWRDLVGSAGFVQLSALDTRQNFHELPLGPSLHGKPQTWHILALP